MSETKLCELNFDIKKTKIDSSIRTKQVFLTFDKLLFKCFEISYETIYMNILSLLKYIAVDSHHSTSN